MHEDETMHQIVSLDEAQAIYSTYQVVNTIPFGSGLQLISFKADVLTKELTEGRSTSFSAKGFKLKVRAPGQTNVPIAAAVTSYSRMIINQFKLLCLE